MRSAVVTVGAAMLAAWLLGGCGGSSSGPDLPGETEQYLPLAVGSVWEYNYTEYQAPTGVKSVRPTQHSRRPYLGSKQVTGTDTVTVTGTEDIGGAEWFSVVYQYTGEAALPAIYMRHGSEGLQRRSSLSAQPFFVMKNPVAVGTTWTVSWVDKGVPYTSRLTVRSVSETVATPAGQYANCLKIEDVLPLGGTEKDVVTYWYAPDVGQVREEHHVGSFLADQLELVAYTPAAEVASTRH